MTDEGAKAYKAFSRRATLIVLALLAVTVVVTIVAFSSPEIGVGVADAFRTIVDHLRGVQPDGYFPTLRDRVIFSETAPSVIGAICAGTVLSISGAALQSLIRNPLAEPYTLGISSGAMFGMVLSVGLGISIVPFLSGSDGEFVNAFIFALIPTAIVVAVSAFKRVTPTMMILIGLAVMYIFTALTTLIRYTADPETLSAIYQWSIGSVTGISWGGVEKMLVGVVIVAVPMLYLHRRIDIVAQGDETAMSLGINPNRLRIVCLVLVSVGTAIIVCYTGTIGFVGLVAPHIARIFVGSDSKLLIPCSAVIGSLMIVAGDYVLRTFAPNLPVGVIIAIICSPIFIYILIRMRRSAW